MSTPNKIDTRVSDDTLFHIKHFAEKGDRKFAEMIRILINEAIAARVEKDNKK